MFKKLEIYIGRVVVIILLVFLHGVTYAQILKPEIFIETDVKAGTGDNTPYYSISNKHGIFSGEKNALLLRSGIITAIDTSKNFSLSYGLDAIYRYDSKNEIWLQQAFARSKIYFLIFQGGVVEESFGNQDEHLSSGAYLFSGNARPMPKIALFTNDYITVPFTKNILEIKGYIAHGWFGEKDQYVKNAYLHQKYFYIRVGEKKFPVSVNIGIQHAAMWGGTSPEYGNLPSGWDAFKSVLLAKIKGDLGPDNEQENVLGNHLASYSLGIDYMLRKYKLKFYWQTMLEDKNGRVGVDWKNKGDGLWGFVIKKRDDSEGLQKIVFEYFNSTSQSGDPNFSGNDNYFNNFLYRSGWTFHNITIGTPLFTSPALTGRNPEIIGDIDINVNNYLDNNSVRAFTAGILYEKNNKNLTIKMTYSRNYGTIVVPYKSVLDQLCSSLEYTYQSKRYRNLVYSWQGALDIGSHLGNNAGLMLKIRKTF